MVESRRVKQWLGELTFQMAKIYPFLSTLLSPFFCAPQKRWHNSHNEGKADTALGIQSGLRANQQADSK
jgi:hypothetical protein